MLKSEHQTPDPASSSGTGNSGTPSLAMTPNTAQDSGAMAVVGTHATSIDHLGNKHNLSSLARWASHDSPMRIKMVLLVIASVMAGCAVGMFENQMGHALWPLLLGLTIALYVLIKLGYFWLCVPLESLIGLVEHLVKQRGPGDLKLLPLDRKDEIGRLATSVFDLLRLTIRDHHEAKNLRATLDHRIAQATQEAVKHLTQLTMRDSLTGLGNRRFMDEHLEDLARCVREAGSDLACVLIDMDNFKQVNDVLGHATGDGLLVMAAQIFRASCRREDYVIRLGGDEFVLFMPGCSPARAAANFERVRQLFRNQARATLPLTIQPDLSAGMAWLVRDELKTGADLLKKADENLYTAKRAGKGRAHTGTEK